VQIKNQFNFSFIFYPLPFAIFRILKIGVHLRPKKSKKK